MMLEAFVESAKAQRRLLPSCHGKTVGLGKKSASHLRVLPTKDIWLYPRRRVFSTGLHA